MRKQMSCTSGTYDFQIFLCQAGRAWEFCGDCILCHRGISKHCTLILKKKQKTEMMVSLLMRGENELGILRVKIKMGFLSQQENGYFSFCDMKGLISFSLSCLVLLEALKKNEQPSNGQSQSRESTNPHFRKMSGDFPSANGEAGGESSKGYTQDQVDAVKRQAATVAWFHPSQDKGVISQIH